MSRRTTPLTDSLYDYVLRVSVREPEVLARLREETAQLEWAGMQISPEQGQFMRFLNELLGTRRAIEVGVFTGYSSLSVALAMPDDGRLIACDVNEEWTSIARRYWREAGVDHKIDLRLAPGLETLDALIAAGETGRFDFAFIDADKEGYLNYYERCLVLLRPGGVVALDNALWGGSVADDSNQKAGTVAIRAVNERVGRDDRVLASLVPIGDGLLIARKR
jgi:caffeoyl-CoA O-methyltransferase